MKAPKFEVSLADRQRQKREAVAKIQGKKAYRIYEPSEDLPVTLGKSAMDHYLVQLNLQRYRIIYNELYREYRAYEVKLLHPKEAMLLKLQGYDIEEV